MLCNAPKRRGLLPLRSQRRRLARELQGRPPYARRQDSRRVLPVQKRLPEGGFKPHLVVPYRCGGFVGAACRPDDSREEHCAAAVTDTRSCGVCNIGFF